MTLFGIAPKSNIIKIALAENAFSLYNILALQKFECFLRSRRVEIISRHLHLNSEQLQELDVNRIFITFCFRHSGPTHVCKVNYHFLN